MKLRLRRTQTGRFYNHAQQPDIVFIVYQQRCHIYAQGKNKYVNSQYQARLAPSQPGSSSREELPTFIPRCPQPIIRF